MTSQSLKHPFEPIPERDDASERVGQPAKQRPQAVPVATASPRPAEPEVGVVATHIAPALGYGGVPVTAAVLTRAWSTLGKRIDLVASNESQGVPLWPAEVDLGRGVAVRLYACQWFRRWGFGVGAIGELWRLCRSVPRVYIHGIATWPTTLAALFCWLLKRRFVVAPHGGLMPEHVALIRRRKPHKWLYYQWLTLPSLRRAAAIHCTSETEAQGVRDTVGPDAPILLVPNGVERGAASAPPAPSGVGTQILFLGHIQAEKGINAFIRAWLAVRGPDDRLAIAGRSVDPAYFAEFQSLLAKAPDAIRYHGYLSADGVRRLLAASHFLVLPSGLEVSGGMRENFGNVVAEAMAVGRPVLVARGLAWDHVEEIGAGFVFERSQLSAESAIAVAHSLARNEWEAMSRRAQDYVQQQLDPVELGRQVWRTLVGEQQEAPQSALREMTQ